MNRLDLFIFEYREILFPVVLFFACGVVVGILIAPKRVR